MFKQAPIEARAKAMHAAARVARPVLTALVKHAGVEGRLYLAAAGVDVEHLSASR
jgi:hypothetical protein